MTKHTFMAIGMAALFAACGGGTLGPDTIAADGQSAAARGTGPDDGSSSSSSGSGALRLRCEVRGTSRSKISVDGKNLASGAYMARVASGGNSASSGMQSTIGDEVEFDFDSDRGDIAQGATAISPGFIDTSSDPHVTAEIVDAGGQVVVSGEATCRSR
jgi:hypothetical protein